MKAPLLSHALVEGIDRGRPRFSSVQEVNLEAELSLAIIGRMTKINVFTSEDSGRIDVSQAVGSKSTRCSSTTLPPGRGACPYHYEYDEEWLLVLEGTLVVRAPDGEQTLERGDLVCFPAGPAGAHKVMNRGESTAG